MNKQLHRFAPLGLYLAGAAALVSAGLYIVQRAWNLPLQISLGLIVIGLALFAVLDPERVRVVLTGRQARYGSNALVMSAAFIGILVVVNFLIFNNTKRWDLTEDRQFTLAAETLATLEKLPETVHAQAFYSQRSDPTQAQNLLDQFAFHSKGKFDYKFIDPEADPVAAQQAKISRDASVVLSMGDQQQVVNPVSEQDLTSGLVRLLNPQASKIYFLIGHGEYNPEDTSDQGYSQIKRVLESKNYTVETLNLLVAKKIPEDARLIVIGGPRKPVSQEEVDLLKAYVDKGGSLIAMEEPLPVTDYGDAADPLADYLAQNWGITLGKDIVIDPTAQSQPFAPFAARYGSSPITQKMQRMSTQFPTARSVQTGPASQGTSVVNLVLTDPSSWGETNLAGLSVQPPQIAYDQGSDLAGPVTLVASAENFGNKSRLLVFGDSDFINNANFIILGNADLFTNSADWAVQNEDLINLTPKDTTQRLMLPPQQVPLNLILLGSVFILPGLVLVSGVLVWVQRRKRG